MSTQDYNAAYLNALWNGPQMFERQLQTFTEIVERCERAAYLPPCEITDSTGTHVCNRPSTVFDLEIEALMCDRCFKEIL